MQGDYVCADYIWGAESGQIQLNYSYLNDGSPGLDQLEGIWSVTMGLPTGNGTTLQNLGINLTIV